MSMRKSLTATVAAWCRKTPDRPGWSGAWPASTTTYRFASISLSRGGGSTNAENGFFVRVTVR